ncbi:hypothetical protein OG21DRAFT_1253893 [Imleria badia]|nr:hypothetical protein OG21DRAFT_1253893 [Imleria badia]
MPHVFVVPPEEEQQDNPPWCCFDADEQPENNDDFPSDPDIHFVDVSYLLQQPEHDVPAPLARRTTVHKPRRRPPMSKKLEKKQRPEALRIIENKSRQRDAREDSDVIEVVKVKRGREALTDPEENTKIKRSKTLKARATKALQSIKNVGKASHRTHVKELWTSSESMPGIFKGVQEQIRSQQAQPPTLPKKGSLTRANSRSLSQIFHPVKPARVESTFTVCVASSAVPVEANYVLPATNPSSLPHLRFNNTNLSLNEAPSTLTTDDALNRPISSIPYTKKSTSRKFSVRELHRLFSFSSSPDDASSSPTATSSSARSNSKPHTSTSPRDYPDDPMEEDISADAHFVDLDSADRKLASQYCQAFHAHHDNGISPPRRLSDVSFEMKLDSLHFDSLSLDAEDFHVSREGNILR